MKEEEGQGGSNTGADGEKVENIPHNTKAVQAVATRCVVAKLGQDDTRLYARGGKGGVLILGLGRVEMNYPRILW
jgi:GTPase involved in cell partitioning and DNA repair